MNLFLQGRESILYANEPDYCSHNESEIKKEGIHAASIFKLGGMDQLCGQMN